MRIERNKKALLQEICEMGQLVTLKAIHGATGIDYNKPFAIFKHDGRFTINQILKNRPLKQNQIMFVFMQRYANNISFAKISHAGDLYTEVNNQTCLSKFYAKCDFEKARKENKTAYFIICNKEDLTLTSDAKNPYNDYNRIKKLFTTGDLSERFEVKNQIMGSSSYCDFDFISSFDLSLKGQKSSRYTYIRLDSVLPFRMDRKYSPKTVEEVIDKSGYNVAIKRHNLRTQAKSLKTENKKRELRHADFSKENGEIREAIVELKATLIETLNECEMMDVENMTKIGKLLHWEYVGLIQDYQTHIEKIKKARENKNQNNYGDYITIEQVEAHITKLQNRIVDINNNLREIKGE